MTGNPFRRRDYLKITIFGFALAALWSSLHTIILPVWLLDFVAEPAKNTYLGMLTFTGLILGMIVQPIAGAISDRSNLSWGRRRPYVLSGTILAMLLLPGLGAASSYLAIFVFYCLLQIATNAAQGPYQAFIPDLVPPAKRGLASGVKSLLEILGGVALLNLIGLFMDNYSTDKGDSWLWLALGVPALLLLVFMITTVFAVREQPGQSPRVSLISTLRKSFHIDVRANRDFIWFLLSRLLIFIAFTAAQTFALYFLQDVVGIAKENLATVTALFSLVVVAGMLAAVYPAGYISDRVGRRPVAISAGLIGALGIALLFFFPTNYLVLFGFHIRAIMLWGGLIGIAFGAFLSTSWALAIDLIPKGEAARYLGLTNLATAGGSALSRLIGPLIDYFNGYRPNLGYSVMLIICFVCFVAGSLLLMKIKGRS